MECDARVAALELLTMATLGELDRRFGRTGAAIGMVRATVREAIERRENWTSREEAEAVKREAERLLACLRLRSAVPPESAG